MQPVSLPTLRYLIGFFGVILPVTHSAAQTVVVTDCEGPRVLSATVLEEPTRTNRIQIVFNESLFLSSVHSPINASILTNGTFRIVMFGSNVTVGISNSAYAPGTYPSCCVQPTVTITLNTASNWFYRSNYYILLNNVRDSRGYGIAPNTIIPVTWPGQPPGPVPPSANPVLSIRKVGSNGIHVSWPTNAYGYALEWTTNIAAFGPSDQTNLWCTEFLGANPYIADPAPDPYRFYRLHKKP